MVGVGLLYAGVTLVLGGAQLLAPPSSDAHIVPEEPWHPVAGGYLRALFYLNLRPIDWDLVAAEYAGVVEAGYGVQSVYQGLALANGDGIDHPQAIRAAVNARDAAALYAASTRAVSQLVRYHLDSAAAALDTPGAAQDELLRAQAVYRALAEDWLEQFAPEAFVRLGRRWLELSTSVGTAGIGEAARVSSARTRFDTARQEISDYLIANYETGEVTPQSWYAPTPALALRTLGSDFRPQPALPPGSNLNDQAPLPRLVLNFEERGIDEKDLFLVAYGDMLFDSPAIFGSPARELAISCSTCHNRSDINRDLFIPGISVRPGGADVDGHFFNPRFNDRRADALDTPSLRGIRFTAPYGRDGRFGSLREFTRNVIVNEFAGAEPTPLMLDALVSYVLEFDWLPNPLLRTDGSLTEEAGQAALRGERVFTRPLSGMGGLSCASCHIPGSNFRDGLQHDIGSGNPASPGALDSAFDTPTLLNASFSAPYLHDGSIATLDGVVEWFDSRFDLRLSRRDKADLTAYLEAVGGGVDPFEVFDADNTLFMLFWGELSTFISTLGTLIPDRDRFHADLLIDTVVPDLIADAGALEDTRQVPLVLELVERLRAIQAAWQTDDWQAAEALWREYQEVEAEYGPRFR
jgi:cytochrome c peroxidase